MKILWLSDIHVKAKDKTIGSSFSYKPNYIDDVTNSNIENFFKNFNEKIQSLEFDCIVISGDLAFNSSSDSYHYLTQELKFLKNKPVLVVPGNHDLDWEKIEYSFYIGENMLNDKTNFIDQNETYDKLESIFHNYSEGLKDWGKFSDKWETNNYYSKKLSGCIENKEKKIIFNLINSAWFSIGSSYEKYINKVYSGRDIDELLKMHNLQYEQGHLITGINNSKYKPVQFTEIINKNITDKDRYKDYFIITVMHHPLDWLDASEMHNYQGETTLAKVIGNTDLLLTGHVHPSKFNKYDYVYGNRLHLNAPLFLDYSGDPIKPDAGFVILDIDKGANKINAEYYYFQKDSKTNKIIFSAPVTYTFFVGVKKDTESKDTIITPDVLNDPDYFNWETEIDNYNSFNFSDFSKSMNLEVQCLKTEEVSDLIYCEANKSVNIYSKEEKFIDYKKFYTLLNTCLNDKLIEKIFFYKHICDYQDLEIIDNTTHNKKKLHEAGLKLPEIKQIVYTRLRSSFKQFTIDIFNHVDEQMKDDTGSEKANLIFNKINNCQFMSELII